MTKNNDWSGHDDPANWPHPKNVSAMSTDTANATALVSGQMVYGFFNFEEMAKIMVPIYEAEREKYRGGLVYYPNNQAAFEAAMVKALQQVYLIDRGMR